MSTKTSSTPTKPDPAQGKKITTRLITSLQSGAPASLDELHSLEQTMKRRRDDILAFFRSPRHLKTAHRNHL